MQCADKTTPRAGKVRNARLPIEYLLERVVEKIHSTVENAIVSWNTSTPACQWHGVKCDETESVASLHWAALGLHGSIFLDTLPPTLLHLDISSPILGENKNALFGELSFRTLPRGLLTLDVRNNDLWGTFDARLLPPTITKVCIGGNGFMGEVVFKELPASLEFLDVSYNDQLTGTLVESQCRSLGYNIVSTRIWCF